MHIGLLYVGAAFLVFILSGFVIGTIRNIGVYGIFEYLFTIIMFGLSVKGLQICIKKIKNYNSEENIALRREKQENKEHEENRILSAKREKAQEKLDKKQAIHGSKERNIKLGAELSMPAKHIAGLQFAEGAECFLYLCEGKVIFERNETIVNLPQDKIVDVLIKNEIEIQKSYVSSIGGAVAGATLFGPLGAIVGGRAKEKTSKVVSVFLIFAYKNNEEIKYISFDVTANDIKACSFVKILKQQEQQEITL